MVFPEWFFRDVFSGMFFQGWFFRNGFSGVQKLKKMAFFQMRESGEETVLKLRAAWLEGS